MYKVLFLEEDFYGIIDEIKTRLNLNEGWCHYG